MAYFDISNEYNLQKKRDMFANLISMWTNYEDLLWINHAKVVE